MRSLVFSCLLCFSLNLLAMDRDDSASVLPPHMRRSSLGILRVTLSPRMAALWSAAATVGREARRRASSVGTAAITPTTTAGTPIDGASPDLLEAFSPTERGFDTDAESDGPSEQNEAAMTIQRIARRYLTHHPREIAPVETATAPGDSTHEPATADEPPKTEDAKKKDDDQDNRSRSESELLFQLGAQYLGAELEAEREIQDWVVVGDSADEDDGIDTTVYDGDDEGGLELSRALALSLGVTDGRNSANPFDGSMTGARREHGCMGGAGGSGGGASRL